MEIQPSGSLNGGEDKDLAEESEQKPPQSAPPKPQKTWRQMRASWKHYSVKRAKYLWKHRAGVSTFTVLLALCLFPVWIACTYILDKFRKYLTSFFLLHLDLAYRDYTFTYQEYIDAHNENLTVTCHSPKVFKVQFNI